MIKITINELLNVVPVLQELSNKTFKGSTTFKIARLVRELDKEMVLFEQARQKIAETYGKRKDDGSLEILEDGTIKLQEDKIQECNNELVSLLNNEIEINAAKIPVSAFDDIELTPAQAVVIDSLIEY